MNHIFILSFYNAIQGTGFVSLITAIVIFEPFVSYIVIPSNKQFKKHQAQQIVFNKRNGTFQTLGNIRFIVELNVEVQSIRSLSSHTARFDHQYKKFVQLNPDHALNKYLEIKSANEIFHSQCHR